MSRRKLTIAEALSHIADKANQLVKVPYLTGRQKRAIRFALALPDDPKGHKRKRKYKTFLDLLLKEGALHLFLLCVIALGELKIAAIRDDERTAILQLMKKDARLDQPLIHSLAREYCILPSSKMLNVFVEQAVSERQSQHTDMTEARPQPTDDLNAKTLIDMMWSKAPVDLIPQLGDLITKAIASSQQWKMEREAGDECTDCLVVMVPEDQYEDMSINIRVGQRLGLQLLNLFHLEKKWSSSHGHLPP